jgi:hypothetical protein
MTFVIGLASSAAKPSGTNESRSRFVAAQSCDRPSKFVLSGRTMSGVGSSGRPPAWILTMSASFRVWFSSRSVCRVFSVMPTSIVWVHAMGSTISVIFGISPNSGTIEPSPCRVDVELGVVGSCLRTSWTARVAGRQPAA